MRIANDTVYFFSLPDMYEREADGRKPNTVRWLNALELVELEKQRPKQINIRNVIDDLPGITRTLTDVHIDGEVLGSTLVIFSFDKGEK